MTFIDLSFILFLIGAIIFFYIVPVKYRWVALLVISIAFYAIAGLKYLPFIFVTSLSVFLCARQMGKVYAASDADIEAHDYARKEKKELKDKAKKKAKKYVVIALLLNLAILCVVKYTKFFVNPINDLIGFMGGKEGSFSAAMIIVPLGISYYTFSSLSYLLDVYWRRVGYETNYLRFLLYLIYFPHILQGPIERYGRLGVRLKQELRFDWDRILGGVQLMLWGYFKKLVIADRIDVFITNAYADYKTAGSFALVLAILLDVVYIYSDFSGCMDIARGVSAIFGVELDLNFNHPFSSLNIVEFWRRWHMSLGSWFKDYVYYPISISSLVKNISKKTRGKTSPRISKMLITILPVFCTWVLTGVWHGTGITYVSWGLYYSFMIFMSVTFEEDFKNLNQKLHINTETTGFRYFRMARTTLIFAGGRLLTRPGSLMDSARIFKRVFTDIDPWSIFNDHILDFGMDAKDITVAAIAIAVFGLVAHLQKQGEVSVRGLINKQNLPIRWALYMALVFAILIFGIYGMGYEASSFVYMAY